MNMKHFVTIIGAFGFLTTVSVNAQVDTMKTAGLSQPLSTENTSTSDSDVPPFTAA